MPETLRSEHPGVLLFRASSPVVLAFRVLFSKVANRIRHARGFTDDDACLLSDAALP
jgi:hypothetical protein